MAYTAPTYADWDTGKPITSANIDTQILDNIVYTKTAADSRAISVEVFSALVAVTTGESKRIIGPAPSILAGYNLTKVSASVYHESTSGLPNITVQRGRCAAPGSAHTWVDMLSTAVTIDANEFSSTTATAAMVVNTSNDDIAEGDLFSINIDGAGTGTLGLWVVLEFTKP